MKETKKIIEELKQRRNRPQIGLALSGGGAFGIAHVGVLRLLEEIGLPIDIIVGTSAGALVGGFWASGISSKKMYRIGKQTEWWFLAKPIVFKSGLMSSSGIEKWVNRIIYNKKFSDLELDFAAVATDFSTGELVVLNKGSLAKAMRISCTVPGIYQPVKYYGRLLVDGGLVQNLPAEVCRNLGADLLIGVDLHSDLIENEVPKTVVLSLIHAATILQRQHEIAQLKYVDVLIQPKVGRLSQISFKAVDEFVELGYIAASKALQDLNEALLLIEKADS